MSNNFPSRINQIENLELFLLNLRYREGRLVEVSANRPLLLNDPDKVWLVYSGVVDVFATPLEDGEVAGMRTHLFRCSAGQVLFGIPAGAEAGSIGLLASGIQARLLGMRRQRFLELGAELEYRELITIMLEDWVMALSSAMSTTLAPKDAQAVGVGEIVPLPDHAVAIPNKSVLWLRALQGTAVFLNRPELGRHPLRQFLPFTRHTWLCIREAVTAEVIDTATFVTDPLLWPGLAHFHRQALKAVEANIAQNQLAEIERLQSKAQSERRVMENALHRLASPLENGHAAAFAALPDDSQDVLLRTCRLVGQALGAPILSHVPGTQKQTLGQALNSIANASRVRMREVTLTPGWWQRDNGPLLGFRATDQQPVALLPTSAHSYVLTDVVARTQTPVTEEVAGALAPFAYTFYRPLPSRPLNAWDLLKFGLTGGDSRRDFRTVLFLSVVISLLGLLPAVVTGWLFDSIIPNANRSALYQAGFGLLAVAVAVGMLQIARGIAVLRLQSKMDNSIQAAVWDRLLSLPVSFFRDYAAGDLGARAMGITAIRQILSDYVITAVLTSLFGTFNLLLLFYYAPRLAVVVLGLVLLSVLVTAGTAVIYIRYQRHLTDIQGKLSGTMLQLLTGIVKLRVAGAERLAFSMWASDFTRQKSVYYKARMTTNKLHVFNVAFPLLSSVSLFALAVYWLPDQISTGDFLAFYLALLQFLGAWFILSGSLVYILTIVPVYERMKPILQAAPEVDESREAPGELSGAIEVSRLSFRYREKGPLVLQDVSLQIRPGEFVALVGASGSGKSTLLRLLLGFERPETGGIYYDDQDLNDLDVREVRRQIGVVMQNAVIQAGDIYKNIVGSSLDLTIEDAWEAARLAGFDEDIRDMPMGMHTVVSARGGNLSGGQRQRLLIARALVNKPRIIFFDEATSALDNRTQDIVNHNLQAINATRLVIAHRLTTIMQADRIYLFENGRIVQSGTYDELMSQPGPFAALAQRQLAF